MTVEAQICPRCSSPMVLRTAGRGQYEGQQFWGCSTYPKCRAVVGIKGQEVASQVSETMHENAAGASAQARYERGRQQHAERIRRGWPVIVGMTLIVMFGVYLVAQAYVGPAWAGSIAALVGAAAMILGITRTAWLDSWRIGAEGERKTASYLAGLEEAGFIIRHDRRVPGYGGNVDHIAVGPTGVWVIETKSYRGRVEVYGDRLQVNGQPRDRIVDQVYKEAVAVQIALGDRLSSLGLTVTPILCLHRAKLGWTEKSLRGGVRIVDGRGLAKLVRDGDMRLSDDQVRSLASELDRLFPPVSTLPREPARPSGLRTAPRETRVPSASPAGRNADINEALQAFACSRPSGRVTAVEAAAELDRLGVLRDSSQRPGLPLRNLLRAGQIQSAYQENGRWWYIECRDRRS